MSNKADNGSKPLAAPMVAKIEPEDQRSLNLEDVDMSRACVQGDVLVFQRPVEHLRLEAQKAEGWLTQLTFLKPASSTRCRSAQLELDREYCRPLDVRLLWRVTGWSWHIPFRDSVIDITPGWGAISQSGEIDLMKGLEGLQAVNSVVLSLLRTKPVKVPDRATAPDGGDGAHSGHR